jgi:hypothetical protein
MRPARRVSPGLSKFPAMLLCRSNSGGMQGAVEQDAWIRDNLTTRSLLILIQGTDCPAQAPPGACECLLHVA